MSKFKDCLGREWSLHLTVGALSDVKRETGTDLGKVLRDEGALTALLFLDPAGLVEVLWVLCNPTVPPSDADAYCFASGFDGPALGRAAEALLSAVADFFPRARVGQALKERLSQLLDQTDETMIRALASSSTAGASPGSAASTPAP